jgi:hypothetical protein
MKIFLFSLSLWPHTSPPYRFCVFMMCDFAENVVLFLSIGTIIIGTSITIIAPVISGVCVLINNFYE